MKFLAFATILLSFLPAKVSAQDYEEQSVTFYNTIFKNGEPKIMFIDSIKITQNDSVFTALNQPLEVIFTDSLIRVNNFAFSTHTQEEGVQSIFIYNGSRGVYEEEGSNHFMSSLVHVYESHFREGEKAYEDFEFSMKFDENAIKNNDYILMFTNTGFDFHFKARLAESIE